MPTTRAVGVVVAAMSALALSGCVSSSSPSTNGAAAGSPSFTVVHSNVTHGNLNLILSDLSCASARDCWATGEDTVPSGQAIPPNGTLLMHFDGTAWRQVLHTGDVQSTDPPQLGQVVCPTARWCMAIVGFSGLVAGVRYPTFATITNGRLRLLETKTIGAFSAIDCLSTTDCIGVGLLSGGVFAAARWNGKVWIAMPTAGVDGQASAVSCPTATYCLAVGSSFGVGVTPGPGAVEWNGAVWRSTPRPPGPFRSSSGCPDCVEISPSFSAVSCSSPASCVVLGSGAGSVLFEWDRTAWTKLRLPFGGGVGAISCPRSGPCLAVGGANVASVAGDRMSALSPPPSIAGGSQGLSAVDCPLPHQCVVLGTTAPVSSQSEQMAASWNGDSWQLQPFAAPAFSLVPPDNRSEELGPCTSDPHAKVVTVTLVPHRGFAAVSPTCQIVERGQQLDVRNATKGSATASIGTTFVFTLKPGETAQLRPALSGLLALGHHSLGFTGSNYGTGIDLWVGSRSQQPGYQLTVSADAPPSACSSVRSGQTVAAYTARNEQLYRSFAWSTTLNAQRPLAKVTLCVVVMPNHERTLTVLGASGAALLTTAAPRSVLLQPF